MFLYQYSTQHSFTVRSVIKMKKEQRKSAKQESTPRQAALPDRPNSRRDFTFMQFVSIKARKSKEQDEETDGQLYKYIWTRAFRL